jgi:hypothetical protein
MQFHATALRDERESQAIMMMKTICNDDTHVCFVIRWYLLLHVCSAINSFRSPVSFVLAHSYDFHIGIAMAHNLAYEYMNRRKGRQNCVCGRERERVVFVHSKYIKNASPTSLNNVTNIYACMKLSGSTTTRKDVCGGNYIFWNPAEMGRRRKSNLIYGWLSSGDNTENI